MRPSADRLVIGAGLFVLSALAWRHILHLAAAMPPMAGTMPGMALPHFQPWQPADVILTFVMWSVMMVGMMTPSAAPVVLTYAALTRNRPVRRGPFTGTAAFLLGYTLVWSAFSAGATLFQWALHAAGSLSPGMLRATPAIGGSLLIVAGAWQLTPLKDACLSSCRSPVGFLMAAWRDGVGGALAMGTRHGAYCVGCCWSLMLVLFAVGVMNLLWVIALAAFVLLEKLLPTGRWLSRSAGVLLIAAGVWLLASAMA